MPSLLFIHPSMYSRDPPVFLVGRGNTHKVLRQLQQIYQDLDLELVYPTVYPALQDLPGPHDETCVNCYRLFQEAEKREVLLADEEVSCASL